MENKDKVRLLTNMFISIYLSFMTIQISLVDNFQRSSTLFIVFFILFYKITDKYIDIYWDKTFRFIAYRKKTSEIKLLIAAARKSFFISSIMVGLASFFFLVKMLYLLILNNKYHEICLRAWDIETINTVCNMPYYSMAKELLPTTFLFLFAIICLFPIIYFILLKFKEKFSLKDSLKYAILTTIIVFITLNILYKVAIFLYSTIGILMGGEN